MTSVATTPSVGGNVTDSASEDVETIVGKMECDSGDKKEGNDNDKKRKKRKY